MRQIIKEKIAQAQSENAILSSIAADVSGLVLLDQMLAPIAFDRGAAAILNYSDRPHGARPEGGSIPTEILDVIRSRKPSELASLEIHFRRGAIQYICRAFLVESPARPSSMLYVALHLERDRSDANAVREFGDMYRLTKREHEALGYLSMGLTSKEVADRMNISPQTVKAFLRGIMVKMGAASRGEIFAKLLEYNSPIPRKLPYSTGPIRSARNE